MAKTIIGETKRKVNERPKDTQSTRGRELVPIMVGHFLTHSPSNVGCMQSWYLITIRGLE